MEDEHSGVQGQNVNENPRIRQLLLAAIYQEKLERDDMGNLDIVSLCGEVMNTSKNMAIGLSGSLMCGIALAYQEKVDIVMDNIIPKPESETKSLQDVYLKAFEAEDLIPNAMLLEEGFEEGNATLSLKGIASGKMKSVAVSMFENTIEFDTTSAIQAKQAPGEEDILISKGPRYARD